MPEPKRVLKFRMEDSKQIINIVEGISKLKADIDVDSTPSSVEISIYGPEDKVKDISKKVRKLVEESR